MRERQVVFILGMGRSGTSAISRLLSLCGGSLPAKLVQAHESNPKGHWEPLEALQLNDLFLHRHGSAWHDPTLRIQEDLVLDDREREAFVNDIGGLLDAWPAEGFLVIKEPKITALTASWFDAASRQGFAIKVVIPVRHPEEVSASLAVRDQMSADLSNLLWLKYNLLAERESRSFARVFVEYSNVIGDWRKEVGRISRALSIDLAGADEARIEDFLARDLYRQRRSSRPVANIGPLRIGELYSALSAAAHDAPLDAETLDGVFQAYRECGRAVLAAFEEFRTRFGPTPPLESQLAALVQERDAALIQLTAQDRLLAGQQTLLKEQESLLQERGASLENLRRVYAALSLEVADERAKFEQAHAAAEANRVRAEHEASDLRGQLEAVLASSSWRLTRPLRSVRSLSRKLRSPPSKSSRP